MEKFTFNDLKIAISKLSEEQLSKQVFVQREEETVTVNELAVLEEDIYQHIEVDEECGPLEDLKTGAGDDFKIENYKLVTPKGTPFLAEEF